MAFVVSQGALQAVAKPAEAAPYRLQVASDLTADYAALWRSQPAVRTVVSFLARNIAQLGLHAFERVSDDERRRLTDHPVARCLSEPNPWTTRYRLFDATVHDVGIYDAAYWLKLGTPAAPGVLRLPPKMTKPTGDSWLFADGFEVRGPKGSVTYPADRVVYFHGYNPDDPRSGSSPIESLRARLAEEHAAAKMREQVLRNGARLSGYISRPKPSGTGRDWSDAARSRFRAEWQAQYVGDGPQAGGTPILEDGMQFVAASQTAEQLEYVAARKLTREEVAAAYFIPPPMVGILDHATFGNIEEQHKMLYADTLGPWLTMLQEDIGLQLVRELDPGRSVYVEFNMREKLRGTFKDEAAVLFQATGRPYMTVNEGRARQNLPAVEGGDVLVLPLNVALDTGDGAGGEEVQGAADVKVLVDAAAALIRSGFDPAGALAAVGLDPIEHLGLLPVSVQRPAEPDAVDQEAVDALKSASSGRAAKAGRLVAVKTRPTDEHTAKAEKVIAGFFRRQATVIRSRLGAKAAADLWDDERWDRELAEDLYELAVSVSSYVAGKTLDGLGLDPDAYDVGRTVAFLRAVCERVAGQMNATTKAQVLAALAATEGDDEADPREDVAHVFEVAAAARAPEAALSTVTVLAGFGSVEAARQVAGEDGTTKTWVTTSSNPRASHARLNGETVPVASKFSNGAMWPADALLDVDDRAGCRCDVVITRTV